MRTLYISCVLAVAVLALLFEEGVLPVGFLPTDATMQYVFALLCVAMTFGNVFVALRLFKSKKVVEQLNSTETSAAFAAYRKWNTMRILLIFLPAMWNLIVYYGLDFNSSAMYCFLIVAIGALFCWPTSKP